MLELSATLEVEVEAVVDAVDDVLELSEPVEVPELLVLLVLLGGGGGGGPSIMPNSLIEPKLDEAELVPVEKLDSSCCSRSSRLLDRSSMLEVEDADVVDEVDELPPEPPTPPMPCM